VPRRGHGPRGRAVRTSERRERTNRALLERPVGGLLPGLPVAAAALDGSPGVRAVQDLEDGEPRQAMRAVELTRDVPAHVPEHAAEVEDDAAQTRLLPEGARRALACQELVATKICSTWEAAHALQHFHR
jgi:hypothetical protein